MAISFDQLMGWWKLSEAWHEFETATRKHPFGGDPSGSLVFTPDGRMMLVILATPGMARSPGHDVEAVSGSFALDGSEIVTKVDLSSNEPPVRSEVKYRAALGQGGLLLCLTSRQFGRLYGGTPFTQASNWYRVRAP